MFCKWVCAWISQRAEGTNSHPFISRSVSINVNAGLPLAIVDLQRETSEIMVLCWVNPPAVTRKQVRRPPPSPGGNQVGKEMGVEEGQQLLLAWLTRPSLLSPRRSKANCSLLSLRLSVASLETAIGGAFEVPSGGDGGQETVL